MARKVKSIDAQVREMARSWPCFDPVPATAPHTVIWFGSLKGLDRVFRLSAQLARWAIRSGRLTIIDVHGRRHQVGGSTGRPRVDRAWAAPRFHQPTCRGAGGPVSARQLSQSGEAAAGSDRTLWLW